MSNIKAIALDILTKSVDRLSSDEEIEEIYKCIDLLNETIEDQQENYRLLAECYAKVQNYKKAKEVFAKIYNTKNKKDLKKYSEYLRYQQIRPIIRPSKRAKLLPDIKYVSKEMAESMLIRNEGTPCEICNSTTAPLYVGLAFNDDDSKVCCANLKKKFCLNCLLNGSAAKLHNISFNNKLVRYFSGIENDKKEELIFKTPSCSSDFDLNEDVWPICCGDFCKYMMYDEAGYTYFKCNTCGKTIKWGKYNKISEL